MNGAIVRFGCERDARGVELPGRVIGIDTSIYYSSPADHLDYALVRLSEKPLQLLATESITSGRSFLELLLLNKHRGHLVPSPLSIQVNDRINIIQFPHGHSMKVVLTENRVAWIAEDKQRVRYIASTDNGSSGSPVLNQYWDVVAIHHSGDPYPPGSIDQWLQAARKGYLKYNEGIPINAILEDLELQGARALLLM